MMSMDRPSSQRRASNMREGIIIPMDDTGIFDSQAFGPEDLLWPHTDPYPFDPYLFDTSNIHISDPADMQIVPATSKKRKRESNDHGESSRAQTFDDVESIPSSSSIIIPAFPEPINIHPYPTLPIDMTWQYDSRIISTTHRQDLIFEGHPFIEVSRLRYTPPRKAKPIPDVGISYIKLQASVSAQFRATAARHLSREVEVESHRPKALARFAPLRQPPVQMDNQPDHPTQIIVSSNKPQILPTPSDMGNYLQLDEMDRSIHTFYVSCMCPGRTLLPETNGWQKELLPMSDVDPIVHHALLAFSAGYCLEYLPHPRLFWRANEHYNKACSLLTKRLTEGIEAGQEDVIVGALRVLWSDDIVQWELRRDKLAVPRWFEAAQLAKQIMKKTDTGYRYWQADKRQCAPARISNANMLALIDIVASMARPLPHEDEKTESPHPWLLAGDEKDALRINGGTGLCPKLLHVFAQITHICAVMELDPQSIVMPLGAKVIEQKLLTMRQWSELSPDPATHPTSVEALLESCQLDEDGLVTTAIEVTDLGAQAWVQAARIYMRFRFYRLPREHPDVQEPFQLLKQILQKLPCSGELFTSQSPFYPVFLFGLAAISDVDRGVARHWFTTVVEHGGSRSSVPPVWHVLQKTWDMLDHDLDFDIPTDVDQQSIGQRKPWWETMVQRWNNEDGLLCIV